jgi:hypothetical protein
LIAWRLASEDDLDKTQSEQHRWAKEIRAAAEQGPPTGIESIWDHVYA